MKFAFLRTKPSKEENELDKTEIQFDKTNKTAKDSIGKKEIEKKLIESEKKYRRIFNLSPEGIVVLDRKGFVLEVNRRLFDWLGYKPKEIIGKNIFKPPFMPVKSKLVAMTKLKERLHGENLAPYNLVFTSKTGKPIIGRINAAPITDNSGKIIGDLVMVGNVTNSEELEKTTREAEERYKLFFEEANDLIQRCDPDGNFLEVNKKWVKVLGYSKKEAETMNLKDVIHPDSLIKCMNSFRKVILGKKVSNLHAVFISKKGKPIHLEVNATPIFGKNRKLESTLGFFRVIKKPEK